MSHSFIPRSVYSGLHKGGHVQGIAVDTAKGHMYYSFTTVLVKTDFEGNLLGSVRGLAGHLGCITFDPEGRRVIGSLELKHDSIGQGIMAGTGRRIADEDAFYLVAFDADAIDRPNMDAEADGIMRAVWLSDVVEDYNAVDEISGCPHRYGCSGIDGTAIGPVFGEGEQAQKKIMVAYGIYGDVSRSDNDYQVILRYDPSVFDTYGAPLRQNMPHHSGPAHAEERYFFYTGNTTWGVQNLEYDAYTGTWLMAVYTGQKEGFPNYPMFLIDGSVLPHKELLRGRPGETGEVLTAACVGQMCEEETPGVRFPLGSTGIHAFGDGTYAFSLPCREGDAFSSTVVRYRMNTASALLWVEDE